MSVCMMEEGHEEVEGDGAGDVAASVCEEARDEMPLRRETLLTQRYRRACSEQGPHPSLHLIRKYNKNFIKKNKNFETVHMPQAFLFYHSFVKSFCEILN